MKSFNDIRTKVELAESPLKEAMGHISAIQGMIAKERGLEKKRDATKSKDSGWQKPDSKQTAKPENRAKKLARGAMKSFKQVREDLKLVGLDEAKLSQQQRNRLDDLIFNVMITGNIEYDGKDTPTKHLKTIEKEFSAKVAKQVEAGMDIKNWGRDNHSSGFLDSLAYRKKSRISASGKMNKQDAVALGKRIMQDKSFGGLTKKVKLPEEAQIDEKTGVFGGDYTSKDHMMGMKNFMSIRDKKAKQRDAEHQAQDPKMAKMGYAKHMMDMDKAKSKAAKKGVNPSKTSRSDYETRNGMNPNRKLPEDAQIGEAKVGPSHDEIMKAIGHTQSSAQGMAILQKKFKLTPQQARKHMDMFLKDDVQIDEISMTKMADYAPKAVKSRNDAKSATSSADSNRRATAKKILDKRKTGANNYNKKMWGYGKVAPTK